MVKERPAEKDYQEFIECLNKHKVDYMILGAYAVIRHTRIARETKDIDFWIKDNIENAKKTAAAIKEFSGITVDPRELIKKDEIYYIGRVPRRIDIFCNQADLNYDNARKNAVKDKFLDFEVSFISAQDLLKLKRFYKSEENEDTYGKDIKRLENVLEQERER
ncbi:MAG TPA: hypothetical protein DEE98_08380 [Elusimicrobia bacterium]|nr:MAG: hypothetical protein A2278_09030 [Elusimicrobia bacterium RIFOXYA12_FULL_49_49]OGS10278.1 MAG: hypothetical protein A2204_08015 [Elusimicrobia bacterium RIFOXYA1_FULL_47_7]OGS11918.1 MAG: hypothetical protein A2386_08535 [Elusimicrobia bacterium RIFOXYB1_FULL_48_9]OGS14929.1 MAG: hypothetical protein A2251_07885 [Elusimicrobia bacterium RIFOXYA2_FULL_47_53]OGS26136.1 MAG: hypothetical protein A2339_02390 [Elusimicrobia bacterium RIFOXYB12_FULL_50_12]OGS29274.1 MAG: hypothetical protein